jgi:2',3'-cyclic-nucleotide 2'-phosphodiesterase (5'-nucleotidase family)
VLDIDLEDGRLTRYDGRLWPVTARLADAPRVKAIADVYQAKLAPLVNAVVATSSVPLPGDSLLYQETALGNLITDIMRQRAGADIAFQNAGGIRGELPAGDIRVGDVYTLLPFDNTMVVLEMSGADVERLCRESAGRRGRGGFGQVSGLSFEIAADGPRNVRVGGLPVDPKQRYRLVTNSYTASGGDGYGAIGKSTARQDTDLTVREAVMTGLRQLKTVSPKVEGRIRFVK